MKIQNPYKYLVHFLFLGLITSGLLGFTQYDKTDNAVENNERGAHNVKQITKTVYNALKMDDFDMLQSFIPNEEEMAFLRIHHKDLIIHDNDADLIKADLNKNFKLIIKSGIDQRVNWTTLELVDSQQNTGENKYLCNLSLTLDDHKNHPIRINIQAIKIKDKWFLVDGFYELEKTELKKGDNKI